MPKLPAAECAGSARHTLDPALALQRLALVDAAASWLSESDGDDQLAHALLAAACMTEVAAEHAYPALIILVIIRGACLVVANSLPANERHWSRLRRSAIPPGSRQRPLPVVLCE